MFTVSVLDVYNIIRKIKKPFSRGTDHVCAKHLLYGTPFLFSHLALLFQMVFTKGIVPASFSTGRLTPVPKKNKPLNECSSYRPITVATTFCKIFEKLIMPELVDKCYMPPHQFGFQKGIGCAHALTALSSVLIDADKSGEPLILGSHDVSRAFDSIIHAHILTELYKRGVSTCIIRALYDMYNHLTVIVNLPHGIITKITIPVRRGVRQGALTSPIVFNNCILDAQSQAVSSCILEGIDVSLIAYADDVFNPSRTVLAFEKNFSILSREYSKINLKFNAEKSEVVLFNWGPVPEGFNIDLNGVLVAPKLEMNYLGLPIGNSLKATKKLLIRHFQRRTSSAYGGIVSNKLRFNRQLLAKLYNSYALPNFLYLAPFWRTFSATESKQLRRIYYRYAKYLLSLPPPWASNSWANRKYGLIDPNAAIGRCIAAYNRGINGHPWCSILKQ